MNKQNKNKYSYWEPFLRQTNRIPIFYKYLSFANAKLMLEKHNIQFTRGDGLNDTRDLDICKCDLSIINALSTHLNIPQEIITPKLQTQAEWIKSIGVCSLGQTGDNLKLWKEYASSKNWLGLNRETGICIGLDQNLLIDCLIKQKHLISTFVVNYINDVGKSIPWELSFGSQEEQWQFLYRIYTTKDIKWQEEQEVRLVYAETLKEVHKRIVIDKLCFKYVIFGKSVSRKHRLELDDVLSTYPNIQKIYR